MKKISPFLIALLLLCFAPTVQSQVVINEVLSANSSVLADENGSYEDWVELFAMVFQTTQRSHSNGRFQMFLLAQVNTC